MLDQNIPQLLTVRQFSTEHPAFTEGSLRWLIFKAGSDVASSGGKDYRTLNRALVRVGRRVLIDEQKFFDWVTDKEMC